MRRLVLAAAFAAFAAPAWAFDWDGWYVGLNAGMADHDAAWTDLDYDWFGGTLDIRDTDFTGGAQIGHNWVDGQGILGFEADFNFLGGDDSVGYDCSGGTDCDVQITNEWDWLFTLRGRAGITTGNSFVLYLTAGLAVGDVNHSWIEDGDPSDSWPSFGDTEAGYVVGGGADVAIDDNVTLGAEALYVRLGEQSHTNEDGFTMDVIDDAVLLRARINWFFDM